MMRCEPSNQAMQLTASKPAIYAWRVCRRASMHAMHAQSARGSRSRGSLGLMMRCVLIAAVVGAAHSAAAYCDSSPSVAEELASAPLVFVARVSPLMSGRTRPARFTPSTLASGSRARRQLRCDCTARTVQDGSQCESGAITSFSSASSSSSVKASGGSSTAAAIPRHCSTPRRCLQL